MQVRRKDEKVYLDSKMIRFDLGGKVYSRGKRIKFILKPKRTMINLVKR